MISIVSRLPSRQKILLLVGAGAGTIIWICAIASSLPNAAINNCILIYSFMLPALLLGFPTIIDLNSNKIFAIWLIFSLVLLCVAITTNSDRFLIHRSAQFDPDNGVNSKISDHSTWALKSLFVFLVAYWILNQISKRLTGNYIVNTLRQSTWFNADANRKIKWMDVACNIILLFIIVLSIVF